MTNNKLKKIEEHLDNMQKILGGPSEFSSMYVKIERFLKSFIATIPGEYTFGIYPIKGKEGVIIEFDNKLLYNKHKDQTINFIKEHYKNYKVKLKPNINQLMMVKE